MVFHGTVIGPTPPSPRMASFSSRGPNFRAPEILKPDITAPGVEILAAWTGASSPLGLEGDARRVQYNILSGTSMSCPHVSGVAALLRQARPEWSPAAIKSALMTTAYNMDSAGGVIGDMATGEASTPFARGAGHVDPNRAVDPGLVYDAGAEDYISFLCALGYTDDEMAIFTRDGPAANCSAHAGSTVGDHNYPAFAAVFSSKKHKAVRQRRVVRNIGSDTEATYSATITSPAGVRVTVKPRKLRFSVAQETKEYEITFTRAAGSIKEAYTFGSIVGSDGEHNVTSPIAITWPSTSKIAEI
jgi:subtilisin family serine protease